MARSFRPRRGDIWTVSLDPTVGHEIQKTRPAVIVTSDVYNVHNWVLIVMPLTSHDKAEYDQVLITGFHLILPMAASANHRPS